jgi:hypothetical protein
MGREQESPDMIARATCPGNYQRKGSPMTEHQNAIDALNQTARQLLTAQHELREADNAVIAAVRVRDKAVADFISPTGPRVSDKQMRQNWMAANKEERAAEAAARGDWIPPPALSAMEQSGRGNAADFVRKQFRHGGHSRSVVFVNGEARPVLPASAKGRRLPSQ